MAAGDRAISWHTEGVPLDDRIPVRADVVVHEVSASDETVVFCRERGELLLLNDLGAGVFYLVDGRRSVSEISEELGAHFPDAPSVHEDVLRFMQTLADRGAVRFA